MKIVGIQSARQRAELPTYENQIYAITDYFGESKSFDAGPQAFLVEARLERCSGEREPVVPAHFHHVRQFQVFVGGDAPGIGKGSEALPAFSFHYADPSSPYGPIIAGPGGVQFFSLRPRADVGAYLMPGSKDKMTSRAGRNLVVAMPASTASDAVQALLAPHPDGLAAYRVTVEANSTADAPPPSGSGGQYHLVTDGEVTIEGERLTPLSLVWCDPDDEPMRITGGTQGGTVLTLQFPIAPPAEIVDEHADGAVGVT